METGPRLDSSQLIGLRQSESIVDVRREEAREDMVENPDEGEDSQRQLEGLEQYAMVVNRRQQWNTLLQMPTTALIAPTASSALIIAIVAPSLRST
jgi:hypothetical protein